MYRQVSHLFAYMMWPFGSVQKMIVCDALGSLCSKMAFKLHTRERIARVVMGKSFLLKIAQVISRVYMVVSFK